MTLFESTLRMKTLLLATALAAASLPGVAANVDVGVSIGISQPGVYGRIDIGQFPQPQVVLAQPVIIGRPIVRPVQPVYLWVPVAHQQNWGRNCGRYGACGVPVYFVQDGWYHEQVLAEPGYGRGPGRSHGKGHDHEHGQGKGNGGYHGR